MRRALDIRKDQDYHMRPTWKQYGESPFSQHLRERSSEAAEDVSTPDAPPVLDLTAEQREKVWEMIEEYTWLVGDRRSAEGQALDCFPPNEQETRLYAALRAYLGFDEEGE